MFSQLVRHVMEQEPMLTAPPQSTVVQAARRMAGSATGALMVVDAQDRLVGIFTGRDALFRVLALGRDPLRTRLDEVMTPGPVTVSPEATFGYALQLMHERRCHHLPVVDAGQLLGIVSARDAMDPELEEFVCEAQRRVGARR
ncbi:MAG: CBS domain-containing protein [Burkholderiales bacterium]|nr:CBS domain-containing protein [Burkholderiales bacterium]MDE1929251.1 CBS domain-containing protein [Burkholderiales bacterium]MDE2158841.1 CBS domain-containing protein [Burkholderiales bacterium]MDE2504113.1 CBS domain-containing protein [Burkholderiales bacterium]